MIWMYVISDVIGSSSRIIYAKTGDKVAILNYDDKLPLVIHENGQKFYCELLNLTYQKIEKKYEEKISKNNRKIR